jgi:hypothetical protein
VYNQSKLFFKASLDIVEGWLSSFEDAVISFHQDAPTHQDDDVH